MTARATALAFALLAGVSFAQDARKATLAIQPGRGKPVRFVQRRETTTDMDVAGRRVAISLVATTEMSIEVTERATDGTYRAVLRTGRVSGKLSLPPPVGEVEFDSTTSLPESGMARTMTIVTVAHAHAEFPATLDAGGAVTKVEGIEEARKAAMRRWSLDTPIDDALSEGRIRQLFTWPLAVTPLPVLPRSEISVGTAWEHTDLVPWLMPGVRLRETTKLQVTEIGGDEVHVRGSGEVTVEGSAAQPPKVEESEVVVDARLSRRDGLPVAAKHATSVRYVAQGRNGTVAVEQTTTSDLERVAEWPSAQTPRAPSGEAPPPK